MARSGDQIRRNFSLSFAVNDYADAQRVITALAGSHLRCQLDDISCSVNLYWLRNDYVYRRGDSYLNVSAKATFYETMVGGEEDSALPAAKK